MRLHAFVVNLDKDRERLESAKKQLEGSSIPFSRFTGINGKRMSPDQIATIATERCASFCTPGMLGCGASHIGVWKEAAKRRLDYVVVFEDDIRLLEDWDQRLLRILAHKPSFDILLLGQGVSRDPYSKGAALAWVCTKAVNLVVNALGPRLPKKKTAHSNIPLGMRRVNQFFGTHAYVVSKNGYERLLQDYTETPLRWHVDSDLSVRDLNILRLEDPLCATVDSFESNNSKNSIFLHALPSRVMNFDIEFTFGAPMLRLGNFEVLVVHVVLFLIVVITLLILTMRSVRQAQSRS